MTRATGDRDREREGEEEDEDDEDEEESEKPEDDELEEDRDPRRLRERGHDFDASCEGDRRRPKDASNDIESLSRVMLRPRLAPSEDAAKLDALTLPAEGIEDVGPSLSSAGSITESGMVEALAKVVLETCKITRELKTNVLAVQRQYTCSSFALGLCAFHGEVGVGKSGINTRSSRAAGSSISLSVGRSNLSEGATRLDKHWGCAAHG